MTPWMIFLATGVGVYLIRLSGVLAVSGDREIPALAQRALRLVAPAAVTAVVASAVLVDHGDLRGFGAWHLAALAAIGITLWRKNMVLTIAVGGVVFALARIVGL